MTFAEWTMELREHHSLGNEGILWPGEGPDEDNDNPLNAWIPSDVTFEERNVSLPHKMLPRSLVRSGVLRDRMLT
jgi:hypothetical protein